jgi:hypothetical protein
MSSAGTSPDRKPGRRFHTVTGACSRFGVRLTGCVSGTRFVHTFTFSTRRIASSSENTTVSARQLPFDSTLPRPMVPAPRRFSSLMQPIARRPSR